MSFFYRYILPLFSNMDEVGKILDSSCIVSTSAMLFALVGWGCDFFKRQPDSSISDFLSQVQVTCILHNKMPQSPEHEFLVVETKNLGSGAIHSFILERTVRLPPDDTSKPNSSSNPSKPGDGFNRLSTRVHQIYQTILPSAQPQPHSDDLELQSLEDTQPLLPSQQPTSPASQLSMIDRLTASTAISTQLLSESLRSNLKDIHNSDAEDYFLGEDFVYSPEWLGENIRALIPRRPLSLFEFTVLAHTMHCRYPKYTLLREQCYFFARLVYSAVAHEFGSDDPGPGSKLPQRYGHWGGTMVSHVDSAEVLDILAAYRQKYLEETSKGLTSIKMLLLQIWKLVVGAVMLMLSTVFGLSPYCSTLVIASAF